MANTIEKKFNSINPMDLTAEQEKAYKWAQEKGSIGAKGWYIKNHT